MRKNKRVKGYWLKRKEAFGILELAKNRANNLRINEYTAHVTVEKDEAKYWVKYSVAKWYYEELQTLGISI